MARLASYRLDDPEGISRWNGLAKNAEVSSPFSRPPVAGAIAAVTGISPELLFVSEGGHDRAAVITFSRRRGPFRVQVHPALSYYSPLLLSARPEASAVHAETDDLSILLHTLKGSRKQVHLQLPPSIEDVRPAASGGYSLRPFYTYVIDPAENQAKEWSASTRRLFRRHSDEFEVVDDPRYAHEITRLAARAYGASGRRAPFEPDTLAPVLSDLVGANVARIFALLDERGEVRAGVVVLRHADLAAYWIAGSEPGPAMTVLLGRLIEHLRDDDVRRFDLLGANTPSIAEFKRRFGSKLLPFFHVRQPEPVLQRVLRKVTPR